ncbi:MAG: tetratricopeptide repeat protein [Chitinophagales bacterium]|nr:tetratricopeptide repeat protein [Chitinophagales bacterium]
MAKKQQESQALQKVNDFMDNIDLFIEQYKNIIIGVIVGLVLLFGGLYAYKHFIKAPKEAKAKDAIFNAQYLFAKDSFQLALNGSGNIQGFKKIADEYGSTAAGNTAKFYAGVCNLNLKKYAEAVKYLEDFSTKDPLGNARKYGCLGDAYAEQKKMDEAINNYKKAYAYDNEVTAPTYMYRAALALELSDKKNEALELYKKLNTTYPNSQEGQAAELSIGKLEQQVK